MLLHVFLLKSLPYCWNLNVLSAVHARAYLPGHAYEYVHLYMYIYCAAAYRNGSYVHKRLKARKGFLYKLIYPDHFWQPGPFWQPKVVRGRTNFGSQKWSARTTFRPDQFSRDSNQVIATVLAPHGTARF